ncbi:hypothetical protein NKH18_15355 [Streptomyces sp. M10(2022)]
MGRDHRRVRLGRATRQDVAHAFEEFAARARSDAFRVVSGRAPHDDRAVTGGADGVELR